MSTVTFDDSLLNDTNEEEDLYTRELILHAYDWQVEDPKHKDEHVEIRAWCLDRDSNPYLLRFNDFPAICWVELPMTIGDKRVNWTKDKCLILFNYLKYVLGDDAPINFMCRMLNKLYYYRRNHKFPFMLLTFPRISAMEHCEKLLSKPRRINNLGLVICKVLESKISIIRKMLTYTKVNYAQWFRVQARPVSGDYKISTLDNEFFVFDDRFDGKKNTKHWISFQPISEDDSKGWITHPRIISFDIETYSDNHKAMPNQHSCDHVVTAISMIYQISGKPETRKRYCLVYGHCDPFQIPKTRTTIVKGEKILEDTPGDLNVEIYNFDNEIQLIDKMSDIVQELDPEIMMGYNILGYDYKYLNTRLKRRLREWRPMGRIMGQPPRLSEKNWSSGAYGHNSINNLIMDGRISIDMLPLVKRDYRLRAYTLGFVSNKFLGRTKHPVTPQDMFRTHEQFQSAMKKYKEKCPNCYLSSQSVDNDQRENVTWAQTYFDPEPEPLSRKQAHNSIDKAFKEYYSAKNNLEKVMKYCVEDSELALDVYETLNIWIGLVEMSSVVGVTIMELFTQGQQIRCLSLLYDIACNNGYVLDKREMTLLAYAGGFVFEPKPGLYENIICLDFASLYPSIILAFNICYTTLILPEMVDEIGDDVSTAFRIKDEAIDTEDLPGDDDDDHGIDITEDDDEEPRRRYNRQHGKEHYFRFMKEGAVDTFTLPNGEVVNHRVEKGLIPKLVGTLVDRRGAVKLQLSGKYDSDGNIIIPKEKDPTTRIILDKKQLALKLTANSIYGFLGAQEKGRMPLIEGAMSVTAKGRELINHVNDYLIKTYGGKIIYNDSVIGDTPILIKMDNKVKYIQIDQLVQFTEQDKRFDGKNERYVNGIEVWSDKGWTKIKKVIRHYTNKEIYRVVTPTGIVDVTKDHSLLYPDGTEVSPKDLKIGDQLLHCSLPKIDINQSVNIQNVKYCYTSSPIPKITVKNKVDAALLYHSLKNNIKDKISVAIDDESVIIYQTRCYRDNKDVINIIPLGQCNDYVYDLETENHHFSAGIGELVVHNTDSTMADLGIVDPAECYRRGMELAKEVSDIFPSKYLRMEFEKGMRIICFRKKKYAAALISKNGEHKLKENDIFLRGILPARRDNCKWIKSLYMKILQNILSLKSFEESMDLILYEVNRLLNNEIPYQDLLSIKGLGANYKDHSYFMNVFAINIRKHGLLANPGDRLEFLVVDVKGETKTGPKMRLPEMYEQSIQEGCPENIDINYYLKNVLMNPIDQLISIGYKNILEKMGNKGYKPRGRKEFRPLKCPIKMLIEVIADGVNVNDVKCLYKQSDIKPVEEDPIVILDLDDENELDNNEIEVNNIEIELDNNEIELDNIEIELDNNEIELNNIEIELDNI